MVYRIPALDLLHPRLKTVMESQLFDSACDAFVRKQTDEFSIDVASHLRDGSLYMIVFNGAVGGFAVLKDFPKINATYISGIVKRFGVPSKVIEVIVSTHVAEARSSIVTVRTQNDRVVEIMRDVCRVVVPMHREANEDDRLFLRYMDLDKASTGIGVGEDMVARRHYGGGPMIGGSGRRRRSSDFLVRQTTDGLNYYEGDALMLVGYL